MTIAVDTPTVLEEARWFGPTDNRLFGWMMWPSSQVARGGVILAQPVGREARAARRAMRNLGVELARRGLVALRLDYPGTGDSSGALDETDVQRSWVDAIYETDAYLRSLGLNNISGVGMRLGAVILAMASAKGLTLSSVVLWDPCDSGRSFLREASALESLRQEDFVTSDDGSVVSSEWVFPSTTVEQLREMDLLNVASDVRAERLLILTRDDRVFPERLRRRLEGLTTEWDATSEQGAMLDVMPLHAVLAPQAIKRIATWLEESDAQAVRLILAETEMRAIVRGRREQPKVYETFVRLGRRGLFGIVSEPVGQTRGPLVVFFNVSNEEHIGISRLWVDLARRWSGEGVRCVRFDLSGLGDSPSSPAPRGTPWYESEWLEDAEDVIGDLQPSDPSNVVLIGLCSGAYYAAEAALKFRARGACLLNPPAGTDLLHAAANFERSGVRWQIRVARDLKSLHLRAPWPVIGAWQVMRVFLPRRFSEDLIASVAKGGTSLYVVSSSRDISPYQRVPLLRSIDKHRVVKPRNYQVEMVPELDHAMHNPEARRQVTEALDEFLRRLL